MAEVWAGHVEQIRAALRKDGWKVDAQEQAASGQEGVIRATKKKRRFIFRIRCVTVSRRDALMGTMAQAVLESQHLARKAGAGSIGVAVVAAPKIKPKWIGEMNDYLSEVAPGQALGVIDAEGVSWFSHLDLLPLVSVPDPPRRARLLGRSLDPPTPLFTSLNQWLLKILLGQRLSPDYITVPREQIVHAEQLARVSKVSRMTSHRCLHALVQAGHLEDSKAPGDIQQADRLLRRWSNVVSESVREYPAWLALRGAEEIFLDSLRGAKSLPTPVALGLFAAADRLGLGHVKGVPMHLYVKHWDAGVAAALALNPRSQGRPADVVVRIAAAPESIFKAAVIREGLPVCDAIQIWLDVTSNEARGAEQAEVIRRTALKALFESSAQ